MKRKIQTVDKNEPCSPSTAVTGTQSISDYKLHCQKEYKFRIFNNTNDIHLNQNNFVSF
jgi:hypothetical protein